MSEQQSNDQPEDQQADQGLSPAPVPTAEEPPAGPGGADAVIQDDGVDDGVDTPEPRDLDPNLNPATDEALPEDAKTGEDTSTRATESSGDDDAGEVDPKDESPA